MTCPCPDDAALRELQDRYLALPFVQAIIATHGEDEAILMGLPGKPWPTFRDVRTTLMPDLREWFADFFREDD